MPENATHYDVLEVQRNADAAAVRKAYLRASLRYHPDKNPGHEEEAKAKFVQVGQAYETLRDPAKRAAYDRELAAGKFRFTPKTSRPQRPKNDAQKTNNYASAAAGEGASGRQHADEDDEAFQKFAEMFDETVSGMSEQELNMAMGAAAVVGSFIGSIVASRATKGNNAFLSSAAQMVGSAMASRAASTLVQTVHEDSKQRMLEKGEREAAIARGETVQEPSTRENKARVFQDAGRAFQKVAGAAVGGEAEKNT
ncbi:hypothetical protein ACHAXR_011079 [Thalassiosira sp. AJA248-18]